MNTKHIKEFSLITYFLERLFFYLQYLSLANIVLRTRVSVQSGFDDEDTRLRVTKKRGRRIEGYIMLWLTLIIVSIMLVPSVKNWLSITILFLCCYRVFEIISTAINMNIFDGLRLTAKKHYVSSITRTLILSIVNYAELVLLFSVVYFIEIGQLKGAESYLDALYFSVITQLTIGYGDILPTSTNLKLFVMVQGCMGFLFAVLVFSRFVSLMSGIHSVQSDGSLD